MADTRPGKLSIVQTLNAFSQKIKAMADGAEFTFQTAASDMTKLQAQINQQEAERFKNLQGRFSEYLNPMTQAIEQDEENLMKAYQLFLKLLELNKTDGDSSTHLKSYMLTSPLCRKSEYTGSVPSENFCLLRLWFLVNNPDAAFVPEITELENAPGSYALNFIDIDMWQPASFEKEIINMVL